ncbi:MAG: hypothetical protein V8Q54_06760 [Alistipes senegalensis]
MLKREIDTEDRSEAEFEALRRTIEGNRHFHHLSRNLLHIESARNP